jgi:Protein of unknown function (DUF4038)
VAVAFDAVGPSGAGTGNVGQTTLTWTHAAATGGVTILVGCALDAPSDGAFTMTCTCDGASMTSLGRVESDAQTAGFLQVWSISGRSSGNHTILVTASGGTPDDLSGGSISFSGAGGLGTAVTASGTSTTASAAVASNTNGNLIAGFVGVGDTIVSSGNTSRFIQNNRGGAGDAVGNAAGSTAPATGSSVTISWTLTSSGDPWAVLAVEVLPASPAPPLPAPLFPPGWFPGATAVTVDPGGIPFYAEPQPTDEAPAVIIPPTPEAAPFRAPLFPPGWFPGADRVTTEPDGIPFAQQPPPADPSQAILPPPAPDGAGIPEYYPLPPGYFPGSQTVTIDPGGIPFYAQPIPLLPAVPPPQPPYIAGLAGSGVSGYFKDQYGNPRLLVLEQAFALPWNAGRWNSGKWQSDMDAYFQARGKQGHTAWYGTAWGNSHVDSAALTGGRTWDGIYPLLINGTPGAIVTGAETIALNDPFWQRIDYLFRTSIGNGIACFLNLGMSYDFTDAGGIWQNLSNSQATSFGAALAARYPQAAYPNVHWFFGDDDNGGNDSAFSAMLSGIQGAGDTRNAISIEQGDNTNCFIEFDNGTSFSGAFAKASATYNWVYEYNPVYIGVENSYTEPGPPTYPRLPIVWGDGPWYGDNPGHVDATERRFTWWALASGARGFNNTSGPSTLNGGGLWTWQSDAVTRLTTDPNGTWITGSGAGVISYFTGLKNWHQLIPDTNSRFIVAGRGTRATDGGPGTVAYGDTDNYVAGSITPDGSLAVVYCRAAMSITVDQTRLGAGYTATWVDPVTVATQSAGTGSTYNSGPLGTNSAGDPDWVLVFQGPPVTPAGVGVPLPQIAPAWFPGADQVTVVPGGIPFAQPAVTPPPAPPPGVTPGGTAPLHLVVGRRAAARVVWAGFRSQTTNLYNGQTQPKPVVARRGTARALWRGWISRTTNLLNGNPPGAGLVKRRTPARAVWYPTHTATTNLLNGSPPGSGLVKRRNAARAVWYPTRTTTTNLYNGNPAGGLVARRPRLGRAVWYPTRTATTNAAAQQPGVGVVQPRATVPVPRRATVRVLWRGYVSSTTNLRNGNPPGGVIRRRSTARAVVSGVISRTVNQIPTVTGTAPLHLVVARRVAARGVWRGWVSTTTNLRYGNQPGGVIRRRAASRAVWAGTVTRTVNALPAPQALPQPHLIIGRRTAARAVWDGIAAPPRTGKPGTGGLVRRRNASRAVTYGRPVRTTNAPPVNGTAPDHLVIARRGAARAVVQFRPVATINAPPPPVMLWAAVSGEPHGRWAAGEPHGRWAAREPAAGL